MCEGSVPSADATDTREVPVIDLHTHIFNANDLPLTGIINSAVLKEPNVRLPYFLSRAVAVYIQTGTADSDSDTAKRVAGEKRVAKPLTSDQIAEIRGILATSGGLKEQGQLRTDQLTADESAKTAAATLLAINFGGHGGGSLEDEFGLKPGLGGYLDLVQLLQRSRTEIARTLMKDVNPSGDLFVHHMMDLRRAYGDRPEASFEDQLPIVDRLDEGFDGKLAHFGAYDPFRDHGAMKPVHQAWDAGALGIKFYPSSGYSPAKNAYEPAPPWYRPSYFMQWWRWRSRYGGLPAEELDGRIEEFLTWAVETKVPVFAHCDKDSATPMDGYWKKGSPENWGVALARPAMSQLRLCLAHAGGDEFWFSRLGTQGNDPEAWKFGEDAIRLALQYPNVYLDFGYMQFILTEEGAKRFAARLKDNICRESTGTDENGHTWQLGDKLIYGSDWHMMHKTPGYQDYFKTFNRIVSAIDEGKWQRKIFATNAVKFLRLAQRVSESSPDKDKPRFSQAQRDNWKRIIDQVTPAKR